MFFCDIYVFACLPVDCAGGKISGKRKITPLERFNKKHCSLQDEDSHESQFHVDHKSLLGCHRDFSFIHALMVSKSKRHRVQRQSVTARRRDRIPCKQACHLSEVALRRMRCAKKTLSSFLRSIKSIHVLFMDRFVSTSSYCCILMVQSFACLFCIFKSHCADSVVLVHLLRSLRVSMHSRSDFPLLSSQCTNGPLMRSCRIALYLPHPSQYQTKICGIYHHHTTFPE